jgi:hypothetical protein
LGNGLRVYLERPWYSSGEGELLGVVVWTGGGLPDRVKPYVTQWGQDPLWASHPTPAAPTLTAFQNATRTSVDDLTLAELVSTGSDGGTVQGPFVSVAGYEPKFDEERKLWYVDLEIDAGNAYYPFIRLALVRYQPDSIVDAHLSRVVTADFAQLAPNRTATLIGMSNTQITLHISGMSYRETAGTANASHIAGPGQMEVTVEDEDAGVFDPDLRWKPVANNPGPFTLTATAGPAGTTICTGQVARPNKRCRLFIREY